MVPRSFALCIGLSVCLGATQADARNTFHDLAVADVTSSVDAQGKLLEIPYFMHSQKNPKIATDLGVKTAVRSTNAFNKSDERACGIAFLSALIALQAAAERAGADAVVDIKSITRHNDLESTTLFRCVAGTFVANVALSGRLVRFSK